MLNGMVAPDKLRWISWACLVLLCVGSWMMMPTNFAISVLAGGIISILSFTATHKDVGGFFKSLENPGEEKKKKLKLGKSQYIIKFWLRLVVIGLILIIIIKDVYFEADVFGLLLGLSTVVLTIIITTVYAAGHHILIERGRKG